MKKQFKVKDKVVYRGMVGTVSGVDGCDNLFITFRGGVAWVAAIDCRRLVKKKKPKREPRVVYIPCTDEAMFSTRWYNKEKCQFLYPDCKAVKFIEVIEPEVKKT